MALLKTRHFAIRLLTGLCLTALTAWGVSFWVADYVVRANTTSTQGAMRSLQASIEAFNASFQTTTSALQTSIEANTRATEALQVQMRDLVRDSEIQSVVLKDVQENLGLVAAAVQDAGIDIRIGAPLDPDAKILDFDALIKALDVEGEKELFVKFPILGKAD